MTDVLSKQDLREQARIHRKQLRLTHDVLDSFADNFFENVPLREDSIIAIYMPKGSEFDVKDLSLTLMDKGHKVCVPKVVPKSRILNFYHWHKDLEFEESDLGIMEPIEDKNTALMIPDVVIVPLLAFDQKRNRLGYGGGYYDTTLLELKKKNSSTLSVGVGYAEQACLFNLPVEDHDQKLDWVITSSHTMSE